MTTIAIIGLGYVGLPLAISACKSGHIVNGIDIDSEKIKLIKSGISPIVDIKNSDIKELQMLGQLIVSNDFSSVAQSEIIIICVPTPLNNKRKPDFSYIEKSASSLAKFLKKDSLVILESTVQPGTTRNMLIPLILEYSNLPEEQLDFAYSPERIDPTNEKWTIENTPKVVSGLNSKSLSRASKFYRSFVDSVIEVSSFELAEITKLLENTFRFINISFINEFALLCEKLSLDVNKVIELASTKPYGFMPFTPSLGVGGHCIPVDPIYLSDISKKIGSSSRFIDLAVEINSEMPLHIVERAKTLIGTLDKKRILVVGVAYKPNVSDTRETPVEILIYYLKKNGAQVYWHDDLVKDWNDSKSEPLNSDFDLAILATHHDYLDLTKLEEVPILNTRGSI